MRKSQHFFVRTSCYERRRRYNDVVWKHKKREEKEINGLRGTLKKSRSMPDTITSFFSLEKHPFFFFFFCQTMCSTISTSRSCMIRLNESAIVFMVNCNFANLTFWRTPLPDGDDEEATKGGGGGGGGGAGDFLGEGARLDFEEKATIGFPYNCDELKLSFYLSLMFESCMVLATRDVSEADFEALSRVRIGPPF